MRAQSILRVVWLLRLGPCNTMNGRECWMSLQPKPAKNDGPLQLERPAPRPTLGHFTGGHCLTPPVDSQCAASVSCQALNRGRPAIGPMPAAGPMPGPAMTICDEPPQGLLHRRTASAPNHPLSLLFSLSFRPDQITRGPARRQDKLRSFRSTDTKLPARTTPPLPFPSTPQSSTRPSSPSHTSPCGHPRSSAAP